MSDREVTAETKEPYALARRGLPLRGLAQSAPRAHWLPSVARVQTMPTARLPEPAQTEANLPEDSEFDPFAVSAQVSAANTEIASSPLIRDAGTALSIIADEGFEIEPSVSMPSRAAFDSIDAAAPQPARTGIADATGSESIRTAVSASSDWPTQRSTYDEPGIADSDVPAATVRPKSSTPFPSEFVAPSSATETTRLVSEDAGRSTPRGAIASRERETPSMTPTVSSSLSPTESHNIVVSDARRLDVAPSSDTGTVDAHARPPSSTIAAQARNAATSKTDAKDERRDIAETRSDADELANAGIRHETVEMGAPSPITPMSRNTGDTRAPAFVMPRPLDAAQIASLLSPAPAPSASSGPSVTIGRVQVTVQTPAAAKPASAAVPAPQQAAQQRQAPSPGSRNTGFQTPGFQHPWASYFARRD